MADFVWTAIHDRAALLVAEDEITDQAIADELGVSKRTIENWKARADFAERVLALVDEMARAVTLTGIGRKDRRIARAQRDWERLQQIQDARRAEAALMTEAREQFIQGAIQRGANLPQAIAMAARDFPPLAAGMETGLMVRTEKPSKFGNIVEFGVDTGLLAEIRALEMQVAKELGQITDKRDLTSAGKALDSGPDLRALSKEQLDAIEAILAEAEDDTAKPPPGPG